MNIAEPATAAAAAAGHHPWVTAPVRQPAVFIVGAYRCGTSSLFTHLAAHPEVKPSLIKEPAFFFSHRITQQPSAYPAGRELQAYLSMFRKKAPARVLLEGTANYLNDPGCAERIRCSFPDARIVIALRDPVARLVSWYKFIRFRGWWPETVGFEAWIRAQQDDPRPVDDRPYHLQALFHGNFAAPISTYFRVFGRERVKLVWFDEMVSNGTAVLQDVARFVGINPVFYEDYARTAENESLKFAHPRVFALYRRAHRVLFRLMHAWPMAEHELKVQLFGRFEPMLLRWLTKPADPVEVNPALERELRAYYEPDRILLAKLTDREPSW